MNAANHLLLRRVGVCHTTQYATCQGLNSVVKRITAFLVCLYSGLHTISTVWFVIRKKRLQNGNSHAVVDGEHGYPPLGR